MLAFKQIILAALGFAALASAAACKTDADCEYDGQKCVILEGRPAAFDYPQSSLSKRGSATDLVLHTDVWLSTSL
ncbi:unnamed protein product [Clonostachys byssicola]|uniref:Uncharacterized protein n=1 Tax=Clonostachys byssicola TaxID=160290 RepID=A0A9N9UMF0_9HYPO|nr:unnamed protein product [Clonostachys byssicola]